MRTIVSALAFAAAAVAADPPPASTNWTVISKDIASFALGVAFINETYGYLPADQNGKGAEVLISSDGGVTWNFNEGSGFALAYTDVRAINETVVISGLLTGEHHSSDYGETFTKSTGGGLSQCVRLMGRREQPYGYGIAGQVDDLSKQGVATSTDGGATFHNEIVTGLKDGSEARYAAFPAAGTIYLASGTFPSDNDDTPSTTTQTDQSFTSTRGRVGYFREADGSVRPGVNFEGVGSPDTDDVSPTGFYAQMDKSTDGGKTWVTQFTSDEFYFNGIACHTPDECCAVGESDAGDQPGSRILCTQDGGKTWDQKLFNAGAQFSLLDIAAVGEDTYWAVGGTLISQFDITGNVWLSQDKGNTWSQAANVPKNYLTSIDCVSIDKCWATTANELQVSSVAAIV